MGYKVTLQTSTVYCMKPFLGELLSGKQGLLIVQYEMESEQIYCGPAAESLSPYIA